LRRTKTIQRSIDDGYISTSASASSDGFGPALLFGFGCGLFALGFYIGTYSTANSHSYVRDTSAHEIKTSNATIQDLERAAEEKISRAYQVKFEALNKNHAQKLTEVQVQYASQVSSLEQTVDSLQRVRTSLVDENEELALYAAEFEHMNNRYGNLPYVLEKKISRYLTNQ
jgi:hypothetical protein